MNRLLSRMFAKKAQPKSNIAPYVERGIGFNVYEGYPDANIPFEDPDELVGQHGVEVFRTMYRRDDMVRAAINYRILAMLSTGWQMNAASEDGPDQEAADYVEHALENMRGNFTHSLRSICDCIPMGFSAHEKVWAPPETEGDWAGKQGFAYLKSLDPRYVKFPMDEHGELQGIWQHAQGYQPTQESYVKFDRDDLIYWPYDPQDGNPYGAPALRSAYRWYFAKDGAVRLFARYLERHGYPNIIGRYPEGSDSNDIANLNTFIKELRTSMGASFKESWGIEIHQMEHQAQVTLYESMIQLADRAIARACLLPALILENTDTGAYALGKAHNDQFAWILKFDREGLQDVVNEQLVKPLVAHNFANAGMPTWELKPFAEEDLESLANMAKTLIDAGKPIPESWFNDRFGLPEPEEDEEVIGGRTPVEHLPPGIGVSGTEPQQAAGPAPDNTEEGEEKVEMAKRREKTELEKRIDFEAINAAQDRDMELSADNFGVIFESIAQDLEDLAKKGNGGRRLR